MPTFRTSGTTGSPKHFALDSANLAARAEQMMTNTRPKGFAKTRSLYCDYAEGSAVRARYAVFAERCGIALYGPLATFVATIEQFAARDIRSIAASPQALVKFAAAMQRQFDYVISASAMLTPEMSRAIRASFGDNLWTIYSASEVGTISFASAAHAEVTPGCVGKPCVGAQVRIVNDEVQVKTPTMTSGYDDPALTAAKFADGWFRTGDRGHIAGDGSIILEGRP